MDYSFRKADPSHIPAIVRLMAEAVDTAADPDWFVADDENYIRAHISHKGFTVLALSDGGDAAGFFAIDFPGTDPGNLGRFLDMDDDQLSAVAHMDTAVVTSAARGHHLQARMLAAAEELLQDTSYRYYMCTVHPDNVFSLNNMLASGYRIADTRLCYGGLPRHILLKEKASK